VELGWIKAAAMAKGTLWNCGMGIAGRVIEHGRKLFLKIANHHPSFHLYKEAREKLVIFSSA
jgi:signal transduction protein with GAF and PtsI domain